jgi:hypothetical protein
VQTFRVYGGGILRSRDAATHLQRSLFSFGRRLNLCVHQVFFFIYTGLRDAYWRHPFVLVAMQEARDLTSQCDRLQYVPQRACGIEKLALQLRWDRTPMHHDGRAEAPQNMLLDLCDCFAVERFRLRLVLGRQVSRMNHFVEVIRQPVFVLGQVTEAFNRLLEFPDFARGVGIFD